MRMRFTKEEKAAFTVGATVEWRTGRYWYTGEVIAAPHLPAGMAIWETTVRNTDRTAKVPMGHIVCAGPTAVRVPQK